MLKLVPITLNYCALGNSTAAIFQMIVLSMPLYTLDKRHS